MAPITLHLTTTRNAEAFVSSIRTLSAPDRPLYVGQCHHWIHAPHTLSIKALLGEGPEMTKWDYLIIFKPSGADSFALPSSVKEHIQLQWSITAEVDQALLESYTSEHERRLSSTAPSLPAGWSVDDHSGLDASVPPSDLEASLGLQAHRLGASREIDEPVVLKDYLRTFGTKHDGPVQMLNLDSCNPGQLSRWLGYISAFGASVGVKYGGEGAIFGHEVTDWSSRAAEGELSVAEAKQSTKGYGVEDGEKLGWEVLALVWYPSVWHCAKMLDDPLYAEADRKYKIGVLRDGPILMCTEVDVEYDSL